MIEELLLRERITLKLKAKNKEDIIRELLEIARCNSNLVFERMIEREKEITTGIGKGIAIPRYIGKEIDSIKTVIGIKKEGVNFSSFDRKSANIFFLLLAPESARSSYIHILSQLIKLGFRDDLRAHLLSAKSQDEIANIIKQGMKANT
jgi:mannitol/fructose-specific phosphotransferase system IIA component (Ntr-type)